VHVSEDLSISHGSPGPYQSPLPRSHSIRPSLEPLKDFRLESPEVGKALDADNIETLRRKSSLDTYRESLLQTVDATAHANSTPKEAAQGEDKAFGAKRVVALGHKLLSQELHTLGELRAFAEDRQKNKTFWLDFEGCTIEDIKAISEIFMLHPVTAEDCFTNDNDEKREYFSPDYVFMVVRALGTATVVFDPVETTIPISLVVFPDVILSFHRDPIPDIFAVVQHRIKRFSSMHDTLPADWIAYAIIDAVADEFIPCVRAQVGEVLNLDDLVIDLGLNDQVEFLARTKRVRRRLNELKHVLMPKREMLAALAVRDQLPVHILDPSIRIYLRDVLDHVEAMLEDVDQSRDIIAQSQATYLAKLSVEVAMVANRTNNIMKIIALASAIFLPLTLIAGIFGMNVNLPFQTEGKVDDASQWGAFWFISAFCFVFAATLLGIFKKLRWI